MAWPASPKPMKRSFGASAGIAIPLPTIPWRYFCRLAVVCATDPTARFPIERSAL
jgi:hypothetical protein